MTGARLKGTISRLFITKGYGFVMGEDGQSRFMHVRDFVRPELFEKLREGQGVSFIPTVEDAQQPDGRYLIAACPECGCKINVTLEPGSRGKDNNNLRASQVIPCS